MSSRKPRAAPLPEKSSPAQTESVWRKALALWKEIGAILGVLSIITLLIDNFWPRLTIDVAGVAPDARTIQISVENTGKDAVLMTNFRIEPLDPELASLFRFGKLTQVGDPNAPTGRHTALVAISHVVEPKGWDLHDEKTAMAFFEKYGDKRVRISADATRRGKKRTLTCDVPIGQISVFLVNRSTPEDAAP